MTGKKHGVRNRMKQQRQQDDEQGRSGADRDQRGCIDTFRIRFLIGEAEEARLHAIIEDDKRDGGKAVEVTDDAVFFGREKIDV